jgi:hypothetical protein
MRMTCAAVDTSRSSETAGPECVRCSRPWGGGGEEAAAWQWRRPLPPLPLPLPLAAAP